MLYIVRHGETIANVNKQYLGVTDSPLTQKGKSQHQKIIEHLRSVNIDAVYSSPRERCTSLAHQVNKSLVNIDERIAEMNFGIFEQRTWEKAKMQYPDAWNEWVKNDSTYQIPKGESQQQVQQRVKSFVEMLFSKGEYRDIAVVTHGGIITLMLCYLLNFDTKHQWNFRINNGSVINVNITNGLAYIKI